MRLGAWRAWHLVLVSLLWLAAIPIVTMMAVSPWLRRQPVGPPRGGDYLNAFPLSTWDLAARILGWLFLWFLPPTIFVILWTRARRRSRRAPPS
jgi:hypothetical protein